MVEPVANPGMVNARTSLRGRPSRSIALHATSSACVVSSPPLTPMTGFGRADSREPLLEAGDLDVERLVAVVRETRRVVGHEREAVERAAKADVAGRRLEGELDLAERRRSSCVRRLSSKVPWRSRSWRSRSRSTSAIARRGPRGSARSRRAGRRIRRPGSGRPRTGRRRLALPGRRVGVGRRARALGLRTGRGRSSARATVIGLPLRFTRTVAPARAARALGGTAPRRLRRPRRARERPGTSCAANRRSGPNGAVAPPSRCPRRPCRHPARTSAVRRTRGRSAGRTSAPRRGARRGR